jgi:hypothetical protein
VAVTDAFSPVVTAAGSLLVAVAATVRFKSYLSGFIVIATVGGASALCVAIKSRPGVSPAPGWNSGNDGDGLFVSLRPRHRRRSTIRDDHGAENIGVHARDTANGDRVTHTTETTKSSHDTDSSRTTDGGKRTRDSVKHATSVHGLKSKLAKETGSAGASAFRGSATRRPDR